MSVILESVEVSDIDRELARVWKALAEDSEAKHSPVTRVCLHNLLAYCTSGEAAVSASLVIADVADAAPGRFFLLTAEPGSAPSRISAQIRPFCSLTSSDGRTCCELISLNAAGEAVAALPSLLAGLQVGNVPTFLWLTDEEALSACPLSEMQHLVERAIVDGAAFSDIPGAFRLLTNCIREFGGQIAFSGLNWPRFAPWRRALSNFFDSPENLPYLSGIHSVRISYVANEGDPRSHAAAVLLHIGWLTARLTWRPVSADWGDPQSQSLLAASPTGEIAITLSPQAAPKRTEGGLLELTLQSQAGQKVGLFVVQRDADGHALTSTCVVENREAPPAQYRIQDYTRANLLVGQLEELDRNLNWEAAVSAAAGFFTEQSGR